MGNSDGGVARPIVTRAFNRFEFTDIGTAVKCSPNNKLLAEYRFYRQLPLSVQGQFPRVFDFAAPEDSGNGEYRLYMDWIPCQNLGKVLLDGRVDRSVWEKIVDRLASTLSGWDVLPHVVGRPEDALYMYKTKTLTEMEKLAASNPTVAAIMGSDSVNFNGFEVAPFRELWDGLSNLIDKELVSFDSVFCHGDFCLSNILYAELPNGDFMLRFVDPRGSFGDVCSVYGDRLYDIAKLCHSTHGFYEYMIFEKFKVRHHGKHTYTLSLLPTRGLAGVMDMFLDVLYRPALGSVFCIAGAILLGAAFRHSESERRQLAMVLQGMRLVHKGLNGG